MWPCAQGRTAVPSSTGEGERAGVRDPGSSAAAAACLGPGSDLRRRARAGRASRPGQALWRTSARTLDPQARPRGQARRPRRRRRRLSTREGRRTRLSAGTAARDVDPRQWVSVRPLVRGAQRGAPPPRPRRDRRLHLSGRRPRRACDTPSRAKKTAATQDPGVRAEARSAPGPRAATALCTDVLKGDSQTGVAPGGTRGRKMRSKCR